VAARGDALSRGALLVEVDDVRLGEDAAAPGEGRPRLGLGGDRREFLNGCVVEALAHVLEEGAGARGALVPEGVLLDAQPAGHLVGRQHKQTLGLHAHLDDGAHLGVSGAAGGGKGHRIVQRLDAALAIWLVVGRRILDRLAAAKNNDGEMAEALPLSRKVASTVGLAEVVPVRRNAAQAEPLASKYLPLSSLARSDGWILVPADSEGYPAGAPVQVRSWP
jgi:hypothetical protein